VETVLRTIAIIAAAAVGRSAIAVFVGAALFHAIFTLVGLGIIWRIFQPLGVAAGLRASPAIFRRSLPFAALVVLVAVQAQLDILLVSVLASLASVAILQVAVRVLMASDYAPEAAWRWAYPHFSRSAAARPQAFVSQITRLAGALVIIAIGGAVTLIILAPQLIPFAFGSPYKPAVLPMQIVATAIPLRYAGHVYGTALSAAGRQRHRLRLLVTSIGVAAVIEALLIIVFGVTGAAIGLVISSSFISMRYFNAARKAWGPGVDWRPMIAATSFVAATGLLILLQQPR
jgi:O-antigen/teichoic acid export membrane protein